MNLIGSIFTVGSYTLASRVLGFLRDILIAHALGTGLAVDAFFVPALPQPVPQPSPGRVQRRLCPTPAASRARAPSRSVASPSRCCP
jgi:hypothetical protein